MTYFRRCPDDHFVSCAECSEVFHIAHMDLPVTDRNAWLCDYCRPPEPHCETCTCHKGES